MSAYDEVEYPAKPFLQCHPDRLAVMARLFGLTPASVENCRVLEIGCGDGINLLASSVVLPGAEFVGIDLSGSATARGRAMADALEMRNVRIEQRDLLEFGEDGGTFDYVIAHGFYSWVPAAVRDALLGTIQRVLRPAGVAFVSYNAYPGAYLRRMVREMAGRVAGRDVGAARRWMETRAVELEGPPVYRAVVADECADMLRRDDGALFHDDLAEINEPVYFRDFVGHAARHELQYLSEAELAGMTGAGEGEDRIEREQQADFAQGRRFRQTLLCHACQEVRETADSGALADCFVGGPVGPGTEQPDGRYEYASLLGGRITTASSADRMTLETVAAAWPCYVPVSQVSEEMRPRLLDYFAGNLVDLRTVAPPVAGSLQGKAKASALARLQAQKGSSVTSLHHFEVLIENSSLRSVLELADGTRTRAQMIRDLGRMYATATKDQVVVAVDTHLDDLRRYGLLMAF